MGRRRSATSLSSHALNRRNRCRWQLHRARNVPFFFATCVHGRQVGTWPRDAKLLAKTSRQAARHADDQSVGIIEIDLRAHAMGEVPAGTPICDF